MFVTSFAFCVITFEPIEVQTCSAPQNDRQNLVFVKDIKLSLFLLLISNLTNGLHLHQFLVTKSVEANKSVKTDANGAH